MARKKYSNEGKHKVETGNTFVVRSTVEDGYQYFDTVSQIAQAWAEENPEQVGPNKQFRNQAAVVKWIERNNTLYTRDGVECGDKKSGGTIYPGQELVLPTGKKLQDVDMHKVACPIETPQPQPDQPLPSFESFQPTVQEVTEAEYIRAKLPVYPLGGNLAHSVDGGAATGTAQIQDALNFTNLATDIVPNQPVVAARGLGVKSTGIQTVGSTAANIAEYAVTFNPVAVGGVGILPIGLMLDIGVNDRSRHGRQGSNGSKNNDDVAGKNGRIDLPLIGGYVNPLGVTKATQDDATLLPLIGIDIAADGRVIDNDSERNNNNHPYYVVGDGDNAPSVTMSRRAVRSNYTHANKTFLQASPSEPVALKGLNSYSFAALVNDHNLEPQVAKLGKELAEAPSAAVAQKMIGIMNYQQQLVGVSNYDVNADVSKPLDEEAVARLNPREKVVYNRNRVIDFAASKGITGLDANALPAENPVQSLTRQQVIDKFIPYYEELADKKEGVFKEQYKQILGEKTKEDLDTPEGRKAAATVFVNNLPAVKTMPENGFNYPFLERSYLAPEAGFNPVERFEYKPKTPAADRSVIAAALEAGFAGDTANTKLYLENVDGKAALPQRDLLSVGLRAEFGKGGVSFDRAAALKDVMARGYRPELEGTTFSREETHGIIRHLPAVEADIKASANNPEIVATRQQDILALASHRKNSTDLQPGALGTQFLYELAVEPGNKTLLKMEDNIRRTDPTNAEARIETLRQGVQWSKEHVSEITLGQSHSQVAYYTHAQQIAAGAPGVGAPGTREETVTTTQVSDKNVASLLGIVAKKPEAAQALVAAASTSSVAGSVLAIEQANISADKELLIAKAALGDGKMAAALVASSTLSAEEKAKFAEAAKAPAKLQAADAALILNGLASTPLSATAGLKAIAANKQASAALVESLQVSDSLKDGSQLVAALSDAQRADIAAKAGFKAEDWKHALPQQVTHTRKVTVVSNAEQVGDFSQFTATAQLPAGHERDVQQVMNFISNPNTRGKALESIAESNPGYMTALIVQTLANDEKLRKDTLGNLNNAGDKTTVGPGAFLQRLTNNHNEGRLADIVSDLSKAYASGNEKNVAKYSAQLEAYANADVTTREGQQNANAIQALYTSLIAAQGSNGITGAQALAVTVGTTLTNIPNVAVPPLATSTFTSEQTLATLHTSVVTNVDVGNAKDNSEKYTTIVSNLPTGGGINVPFIVVPRPGKDKDKKTPNEPSEPPPGCPECPRPTPPETPTLPTPPGQPTVPTPPEVPTPPVVTPPESLPPVVPQPPALPPSVTPPEGATVGALDVTVPNVPGKGGVIQRG